MSILTGTIEELKPDSDYNKIRMKLRMPGNQTAFIDFRGDRVKLLEKFETAQDVQVAIEFIARISKATGTEYNNLVAKNIQRI